MIKQLFHGHNVRIGTRNPVDAFGVKSKHIHSLNTLVDNNRNRGSIPVEQVFKCQPEHWLDWWDVRVRRIRGERSAWCRTIPSSIVSWRSTTAESGGLPGVVPRALRREVIVTRRVGRARLGRRRVWIRSILGGQDWRGVSRRIVGEERWLILLLGWRWLSLDR